MSDDQTGSAEEPHPQNATGAQHTNRPDHETASGYGGGLPARLTLLAVAVALLFVAGFLMVETFLPQWQSAPEILRVGVLPDESESMLRGRYQPLVDHLSAHSGVRMELVIPADYRELVDLFDQGEVDLAYFGGMSFLQAEQRSGAVPLVMRDVDLTFRSYFLVRPENPANSLAELEGAKFAFGSSLSTSGHLMPRYFMQEAGIQAETWFSQVLYSGAHDETARWIRDGTADAGVANALVIDSMLRTGALKPADVRILVRSPPYADYVWAIQPRIPGELRSKIRNAFLVLSPADPAHAEILSRIDAGAFLPSLTEDFARLRQVAAELGINEQAAK